MSVQITIIDVHQWNARKPTHNITWTKDRSTRVIFHHTAGHHREISLPHDESVGEAIRYAQDIQAYHMDHNGWIDSGHNFLVCRNGTILQGRWRTILSMQKGRMVVSAHCPGFNDQIGIEHEHFGNEEMTDPQRESSARLQAWIADTYHRATVLRVDPHKAHFPTSCPANLVDDIPFIKQRAQVILDQERL